jgi:hypothetical protein
MIIASFLSNLEAIQDYLRDAKKHSTSKCG